ncbi:endonuclease/exonuclease/phosphatase family protein [Marinilongibacter aquaticus]|uniref:endonuclease/exonuclease/phosphatase family protein n=1 Tax=Marinilongibacter aquaticus TaxID=2975157 RepID=UPI0021BD341E|nr:endonuclease/exonuclease/phosphatase family protein [Marinilongibacter aquaticus]UBM59046.1 endonuclease/exonuclease/phosphatase family protein [Marinilongibacter aquaticus]
MRKISLVFLFSLSLHTVFAQKTIKVLSFNILHGATTKGDFDLDHIAKVISDADPDFVAMQEVDFKTKRAKNYDLATELGWRTKMAPLFGKAMNYDGGAYGEAVLSKTSILSSHTVALPAQQGHEPRAALAVTTVLASGDTLTFIGTHLDHLRDETDRIWQVNAINEAFATHPYPAILAGDLNAQPSSKAIQILKHNWTASDLDEKPTFPSGEPKRKIDYVLYAPQQKWRVVSTKVINDPIASDHCAFLVELELL